MAELEDKLSQLMANPALMGQLQALAQTMGASTTSPPAPPAVDMPNPEVLAKLAGIMQKSGIDAHQRELLRALRPYLSEHRLAKLEKAMQAAKIAALSSDFLGSGGLRALTGR